MGSKSQRRYRLQVCGSDDALTAQLSRLLQEKKVGSGRLVRFFTTSVARVGFSGKAMLAMHASPRANRSSFTAS